jgi:GTPase SAR1 family protein
MIIQNLKQKKVNFQLTQFKLKFRKLRQTIPKTMSNRPYDYQYKILIVGDSSVGKTSILTQFVDGAFKGNYVATIGKYVLLFKKRNYYKQ